MTLVSRESAAISIAMKSSLAAHAATLTSDDGSERRAFSIEDEVQKNDLSEMPTYLSSRILLYQVRLRTHGREKLTIQECF